MLFKKKVKSSGEAIQELIGQFDGVLSIFTTVVEGLENVENGLELVKQNQIEHEKSEVEDLQMELDAKLSNIQNSEKLIEDTKTRAKSVITKFKEAIK